MLVVGASCFTSYRTIAPQVLDGIGIGASPRPYLIGPEGQEVLPAPLLGLFGAVRRHAVPHERSMAWIGHQRTFRNRALLCRSVECLKTFFGQDIAQLVLVADGCFLGHHVQLGQRTAGEHDPGVVLAGCLTLETVGTSKLLAAQTRSLRRFRGWTSSNGDSFDQITFRQTFYHHCRCSQMNFKRRIRCFSSVFASFSA